MKIGQGVRESHLTRMRPCHFLFSIFLISSLFSGCASPGEPLERKAPVPAAITDLAAKQSGNGVTLTFTLPTETVDHRPLKQASAVEIYLLFSPLSPAQPETSAAHESPPLLVTIPPAMVARYKLDGRVRYVDVLRPDDFNHPDETVHYVVRTRASAKKSSPDSNVAAVRIFPAPEPIDDLSAQVARSGGVALAWTPPQKTPVGPVPAIKQYRVYRAEVEPSAGAANQAPSGTVQPTPEAAPHRSAQLVEIGKSDSPSYDDAQAELGKSYAYSARSVIETPAGDLESSDSNLATITVRDVVAPSPPQGLVVIFVPAIGDAAAHLELSWAISPETDLAGYNVYRSDGEGSLGTRLNSELLPTPAFRDIPPVAGHRHFYSVTAVDRSGNESSPSPSVSGEIPAESQPNP